MRVASSPCPSLTPRSLAAAALGLAVFFALGCDPPGKPKPEPSPTAEITNFSQLWAGNCKACHSADGKSGPGRPINDPLYLAIIPRQALHDVLVNGRPGTQMPAWSVSQGGPLSDKQIDALVDGIYKNWSKPVTAPLGGFPAYVAHLQGDPANGKKLFGKDCFMCHGPGAPVGPIAEPTYLSLVSNQLLRSAIIEGWPALGMPSYQNLNMGKAMTDQDITDVVAYLASKRPISPLEANVEAEQSGIGQAAGGNDTSNAARQTDAGHPATGSSSQGGGVK